MFCQCFRFIAPCHHSMSFLQLPPDVLRHLVSNFLDTCDSYVCRLVCKRLAAVFPRSSSPRKIRHPTRLLRFQGTYSSLASCAARTLRVRWLPLPGFGVGVRRLGAPS
jgi:hypothetical protein